MHISSLVSLDILNLTCQKDMQIECLEDVGYTCPGQRYLGKEKLLGLIHILKVTESLKLEQVCLERGCE